MTSDPFGDFDISCFADADGRTSRYLPCFIFHLVYHCCSWDKRTPPTLIGGDFFIISSVIQFLADICVINRLRIFIIKAAVVIFDKVRNKGTIHINQRFYDISTAVLCS